jgi:hypothetical protein
VPFPITFFLLFNTFFLHLHRLHSFGDKTSTDHSSVNYALYLLGTKRAIYSSLNLRYNFLYRYNMFRIQAKKKFKLKKKSFKTNPNKSNRTHKLIVMNNFQICVFSRG